MTSFKWCGGAAVVLALLLAVGGGAARWPDGNKGEQEPPAAVQAAVAKGVEFLKSKQGRDSGSWEPLVAASAMVAQYPGGATCLALLALAETGVKPSEQVMTTGAAYAREVPPRKTYVVSLQTAALAKLDPKANADVLQRNVDWLLKTATRDATNHVSGWGYPISGQQGGQTQVDNSNTQYAVLALHAAAEAGVKIDSQVWQDIHDCFTRVQLDTGGFSYPIKSPPMERLSMTSAGVFCLAAADKHLQLKNDAVLEKAVARLGQKFRVQSALGEGRTEMAAQFYTLYTLKRAGSAAGLTAFKNADGNEIDWFRAGAQELLRTQQKDGSWRGNDMLDGDPVIATSFALLFLAK